MMIITASMPVNEPSLFNSTDDGPSFNVVFYFVISDATRAALKDMASASPALKLFGEWCRRAENEPQFRGRFKCMCILDEIEKVRTTELNLTKPKLSRYLSNTSPL